MSEDKFACCWSVKLKQANWDRKVVVVLVAVVVVIILKKLPKQILSEIKFACS